MADRASSRKLSRSGYQIEQLEQRRLLTTMVGGGIDAFGAPIVNVFTYVDNRANVGQINLGGNVTIEAIFMNAARQIVDGPVGDLFQVYVAKSDINSFIAIEQPIAAGVGRAFTAAIPAYAGFPQPAPPGGSGVLVLGALLPAPAGPPIPIIKTSVGGTAIGVRPAGLDDLPEDANNDLSAGLIMAPGQSLGKFMFGGTVFGKVLIQGDMNLFYAGWILTGDARGATPGLPLSFVFNLQVITPQGDGLPLKISETYIEPISKRFLNVPVPRQNFYVSGNLENLVTTGDIGSDGSGFLSGTDIVVKGRLGQVMSLGGSDATVHVMNDPSVTETMQTQREVEGINHPGGFFAEGELVEPSATARDISPFDNDSFNDAQLLGPFNTTLGDNVIQVVGHLDSVPDPPFANTDPNDWYAVGLMAGQTVRVQLVSGQLDDSDPAHPNILTPGITYVGVFDPDGRQIASDYDNGKHPELSFNRPFQFTADRPGMYRFALGTLGDIDFNANPALATGNDYNLTISNVGAIAFGGMANRGPMRDSNTGVEKVIVDRGDLGGLLSLTDYENDVSKIIAPPNPIPPPLSIPTGITWGISVFNGDFRAFEAPTITGPDLDVPNGSVGLVRAFGPLPDGLLEINPSATQSQPVARVGGDYEVVDATDVLISGIVCNRRIGVVRAGTIVSSTKIIADFDNAGFDGTIDLIETSGDLSGPEISHGPGGNVRYIRAGGNVSNDPFFGVGVSQRITHDFNESVTFRDDSGSDITLTPVGQPVLNPNFDPLDPTKGPQLVGPYLTTRTYGIRSGGVVVLDVASSGSLAVNGTAFAAGGTAEISRAEIHGIGSPVVASTNVRTKKTTLKLQPFLPANALTFDVTGSAIVDVLYVGALQADPAPGTLAVVSPVILLGNATRISNSTGGEIVSVNAASIGDLTAKGNLGMPKTNIAGNGLHFIQPIALGDSYPGPRDDRGGNEMPVNPTESTPSVGQRYPFSNPANLNEIAATAVNPNQTGASYGIVVNGSIINITSGEAIGNVVCAGTIGNLQANSDHNDDAAAFEGIVGNIWAIGTAAPAPPVAPALFGTPGSGIITNINIGEGLPWSGSGDFEYAGIFADNNIGTISNQGLGSDLRGDIAVGSTIGAINLRDGAMIDNDIIFTVPGTFEQVRETNGGAATVNPVTPISRRTFPLGGINMTGAHGGIIGTLLVSYSTGPITVQGFGIFSTRVLGYASGKIASVVSGGYGIRDTELLSGTSMNSVNATGNGANLSAETTTPSVRSSDFVQTDPVYGVAFDPFSGRMLSPNNDIHAALGTSAFLPVIQGVTDTGVLENVKITGQRDLGSVVAQTIRGNPISTNNSPQDPTSPASELFPMQISFANSIGTVQTRGLIDGLRITTGRIRNFSPGSDVLALNLQVSGQIQKTVIKGSLADNSTIAALGPNGNISDIAVNGNVNGTIRATGKIGTIKIGGNVIGTVQVDGLSKAGTTTLKSLVIGGNFVQGGVNVTGNVGTIQTGGSLGSTGDVLNIKGSLQTLRVGTKSAGIMNAALNVATSANTIAVNGQINGAVTIGNNLKSLLVQASGANNGILNGGLTVGANLTSAELRDGSLSSNVKVTGDISRFLIANGTLGANTTVQSLNGSIGLIQVSDGNIFGSILANAGTIGTISTTGNLGDGIDPLTIASNALKVLSVGGSILKNVTVQINGPIGVLAVGGNLEAGAVVRAQSLASNQIQGQTLGTLQIG